MNTGELLTLGIVVSRLSMVISPLTDHFVSGVEGMSNS